MRDLEIMKIGLKARIPEFADKLAPIYKILKWEWAFEGVPSRDAIADWIRARINNLDPQSDYIESGGIIIEKVYDEDEFVGLEMSMKISDTVYLGELK